MTGHILTFTDMTHDIRVITIQLPKDKPYSYHAGQYAYFGIEGFEARPFSIASAPRDDNTIDIHVRNLGKNLSHALCSKITQGQAVTVSPAQGQLQMHDHHDGAIVFLAGGTGITPFLAMAETTQSKMHLYWGMTSNDDFYLDLAREGMAVHHCVDHYPVDVFLENPIDNAMIYLSGPAAMIEDSKSKLLAAGFDPSNIIHDE